MSVLRSKWAPGPGVPVRTGSVGTCRVQKGRGASVSGTTASSFFFFMYQTAVSFSSCPLLESLPHSYLSSFPEVIIPSLIFKAVRTVGPCLPTP